MEQTCSTRNKISASFAASFHATRSHDRGTHGEWIQSLARHRLAAKALGDKTAKLGSGERLLLWLQDNRAAVYRQLLGQGTAESGYCQNPQCPNGEGGQPGSLALMRADARYCNAVCRRAAQRVLTAQNRPSNRRYSCGNKRGSLAGKAFTVNSPQQALIRGISASKRDYPQAR